MNSVEKIGLFGGSFNPIHLGHLILAQEALCQFHLHKVIFIPASLPPHKDPTGLIDAGHRYHMVELAIRGNPRFSISDIEFKRTGKSYTIDTVNEIKKINPSNTDIKMIMGLDMLMEIFSWKDAEILINLCRFLGAPRQGYPLERLDERIRNKVEMVSMPVIEISGRQIRERIKNNQPIRYWVAENVYAYIQERKLYHT